MANDPYQSSGLFNIDPMQYASQQAARQYANQQNALAYAGLMNGASQNAVPYKPAEPAYLNKKLLLL